jgi:hypothetical protein
MKLDHVARFHARGDAAEGIDFTAAIVIQMNAVGARGHAAADVVMRVVDMNQDHSGHNDSGDCDDANADNLAGRGPDMA